MSEAFGCNNSLIFFQGQNLRHPRPVPVLENSQWPFCRANPKARKEFEFELIEQLQGTNKQFHWSFLAQCAETLKSPLQLPLTATLSF